MTIKGKNYKVVFRRGRPLTKVVLIGMILICTVALVAIQFVIAAEKDRLEAGKASALTQEQEKNQLENKLDKLGSQEGIVEIAGDELGLHDPDKIIVETE